EQIRQEAYVIVAIRLPVWRDQDSVYRVDARGIPGPNGFPGFALACSDVHPVDSRRPGSGSPDIQVRLIRAPLQGHIVRSQMGQRDRYGAIDGELEHLLLGLPDHVAAVTGVTPRDD